MFNEFIQGLSVRLRIISARITRPADRAVWHKVYALQHHIFKLGSDKSPYCSCHVLEPPYCSSPDDLRSCGSFLGRENHASWAKRFDDRRSRVHTWPYVSLPTTHRQLDHNAPAQAHREPDRLTGLARDIL
jgi:hypothetical protein